jgi:hypothetical protein
MVRNVDPAIVHGRRLSLRHEVEVLDFLPDSPGRYRIDIDRELMEPDDGDYYDHANKLWKADFNYRTAVPVPSAGIGRDMMVLPLGDLVAVVYDLQNNHMTFAWPSEPPKINSAAREFDNPVLYGTPSGLSQVMKLLMGPGPRCALGVLGLS